MLLTCKGANLSLNNAYFHSYLKPNNSVNVVVAMLLPLQVTYIRTVKKLKELSQYYTSMQVLLWTAEIKPTLLWQVTAKSKRNTVHEHL